MTLSIFVWFNTKPALGNALSTARVPPSSDIFPKFPVRTGSVHALERRSLAWFAAGFT